VRHGLEDADERLGRLTVREPLDDRAVLDVLQSSIAAGLVLRAVDAARRASESSAVVALGRSVFGGWARAHWPSRRVALGTILAVSSAVYVALALWGATPPGWLWTIPPGFATAVAALLIASGFPHAAKAPR
jgi:hypothetical protein